MSFNLYDALLPNWRQTLGAMVHLLDKAEAHCAAHAQPDAALIDARLAADMFPLGFQVKSTVVHSVGAIEGVRKGVFGPDRAPWPDSLAGLRTLVTDGIATLAQIEPGEIDGFIGRDMRFEIGERRLDFTAENFLLSFSLPNFYFHATTAYDILRHQGLPLSKTDFLGAIRKKH